MKLTIKVNLLFTAIVSGILLVVALIIFNVSRQNVMADFRQRLKVRAARTAYFYHLFGNDSTNLLKSLDAKAPPFLFNKSIYVYSEEKKLLYEFHDDSLSKLQLNDSKFEQLRPGETLFYKTGNSETCLFFDSTTKKRIIVMVNAENITAQEYLDDLKNIFLIYFPGAALFTLLTGYLFSRNIVRPVKETIHDVKLITSQNLSHRLYIGKSKDELAELNMTINELLNRLEESFAIQRRFISNASHELSTPLTSLSSQIEVSLLHERSGSEYRRVLISMLEDVRQLHQLTKTLLEIAKAGTHGTISLDKIRIDEVIIRAHNEVIKQNQHFKVNLDFAELPENEDECMVFGNQHLLQSAFKNIMENGCKYSPNSTVDVELTFVEHKVLIKFKNEGDTLPDTEMSQLFEPFYRGANAEGKQGVGLGLTLTRRIINLHKGQLEIKSGDEGKTIFIIILPSVKK